MLQFLPARAMVSAFLLAGGSADVDSDGDGLSDFHETHKHFTNPNAADSDGDGVPDGDWHERREFRYTIRRVVLVLRPVTPDVLCDDYQDARIVAEHPECVELEVVHYPLNTVAQAIVPDPNWRATVAASPELQTYVKPGLTANWDDEMRQQIEDALRKQGIDLDRVDDKTLVEKASTWLLQHANYVDGFSTFCSQFVDGQARIYPGMEHAAASGQAEKNLTIEQQWERELFARGMFQHGVRGSCTSSAIYLNGCLRALGIPTRIVLAVPAIDASDSYEHKLVGRLSNHHVRGIITQGVGPLSQAWSSHTFNEVFVGGRWRRLNYNILGQNTLDPQYLGLMTHVATFSDWADGNMAETWGMRQALSEHTDDILGGTNPYSTLALDDRFGEHCTTENPPLEGEFLTLTIDAAHWFAEHPAGVDMNIDDPDSSGHIVVRVIEGIAGKRSEQYASFYDRAGKAFLLRPLSGSGAVVPLRATRGYWAAPEDGVRHFYLRIEPADFERMAMDVPYALIALNDHPIYQWKVNEGVTITRAAPSPAVAAAADRLPERPDDADVPAAAAPAPFDDLPAELAIDWIGWSDGPDSPTGPLPGADHPVLLARVGRSDEFPTHKRFSAAADRRFFLEADGHPTLKIGAGIGGVTTSEWSYLIIELGPADWHDLDDGVEYALRPQNGAGSPVRWVVSESLRVKR